MNVRLGINTCFAVKRWPRPADWAAVVRDELGLELVELSLDLLEGFESPERGRAIVKETRSALADHGLRAETTFTGLAAYGTNLLMHPDPARREAALAWYRRVVDVTAELGGLGTGGHVGTMSIADWRDPMRRAGRWAGLEQDLLALAAHARRAGLAFLLVENLVTPREPATMDRLESLVTDGDAGHVPTRLCLDLSHQCVPGTSGAERDPYAWLERFGARLGELQVSQNDGSGDIHWPFTPEHAATGRVQPGRVLETLVRAGAGDVRLILEVIPGWEQDDDEVVAGLRASVDAWRSAIAALGVGVGV
jgi:sugar phosphate isomerase/epimerase